MKNLEKKVASDKNWEWMEGMRASDEEHRWVRIVKIFPNNFADCCYEDDESIYLDCSFLVPDLADPATLGCLLARIRKLWGASCHVVPDSSGGWVLKGAHLNGMSVQMQIKPTEAEVFISAIKDYRPL